MAEEHRDAQVVFSDDFVARVMETYFREQMFKCPVSILDVTPTESGYMFGLSFTEGVTPQTEELSVENVEAVVNPKDWNTVEREELINTIVNESHKGVAENGREKQKPTRKR
jgi:hypothetical protein